MSNNNVYLVASKDIAEYKNEIATQKNPYWNGYLKFKSLEEFRNTNKGRMYYWRQRIDAVFNRREQRIYISSAPGIHCLEDVVHNVRVYEKIYRELNALKRDEWVISGDYLFNKEQRALNRALGIHALNKHGNKNGSKNKKK
jgi:hypothetical protein